jgi:hypothetical protein
MKHILFLLILFSVNVLSGTITYECKFINFSDSKDNHNSAMLGQLLTSQYYVRVLKNKIL